jgi:hypothetical protein
MAESQNEETLKWGDRVDRKLRELLLQITKELSIVMEFTGGLAIRDYAVLLAAWLSLGWGGVLGWFLWCFLCCSATRIPLEMLL